MGTGSRAGFRISVLETSAPLLSVIVIFRNAARFLGDAVESVFAQTYRQWELLLVDDGSVDGSSELARGYARQDPDRVRYLEHANHGHRGMSASRNVGLADARGQYVLFLDADDALFARTLEDQVAILEAHPDVALVYGPVQYWYSWRNTPADLRRDYVHPLDVPVDAPIAPPRVLTAFLQRQNAVPSGFMVRRDIAVAVGGFEEEFRDMFEDQVFAAKICLRAPVFPASRCWYRYRQHPDAVTVQVGEGIGYYTARLRFLEWLRGYLNEQRVVDGPVWTALRREIARYRRPWVRRVLDLTGALPWRSRRTAVGVLRKILRPPLRRWLSDRRHGRLYTPPPGWVRFGHLRRTVPLSRDWGYNRGRPIDRYYIERFLAARTEDIRGRVLEIAEDTYTRRFGGERVTRADVLHLTADNPRATIIADLTSGRSIPEEAFDCVILTQTLHLIYDVRAALRTVYRVLKPGGVLLMTVPGISPISRLDHEHWGDSWRFTTWSMRRLSAEVFPADYVTIEAQGNVLIAAAFLYGLAAEELHAAELDYRDPDYELLITVRAQKPAGGAAREKSR